MQSNIILRSLFLAIQLAYTVYAQKEMDPLHGFWEAEPDTNQAVIRIFMGSSPDEEGETWGLYYNTNQLELSEIVHRLADSSITHLYNDHPVYHGRGRQWKIKRYDSTSLHLDFEGESFTLHRRPSHFCDTFYGSLDSAFTIQVQGREESVNILKGDRHQEMRYIEIAASNSDLHYSTIQVRSSLPDSAAINDLLRKLVGLDSVSVRETLQKRKGNCQEPSGFDEETVVVARPFRWTEKYLSLSITSNNANSAPRWDKVRSVILSLDKKSLAQPADWFVDSLRCLAYWSDPSLDQEEGFDGTWCAGRVYDFFQEMKRLNIIEIDTDAFSFEEMLLAPSEHGLEFHLWKTQTYHDYEAFPVDLENLRQYLTPAGLRELAH